MGKRKHQAPEPDTYIEADANEANEEANKSNSDVPESAVGKKLASADKKVRDKAVLVLSKWLSRQHDLDEAAHLKIWKALYYCFWMSDKPPVQNELAEKIAQFIHDFPTLKQSALFVRTFFITMGREWPGIDKLRLNKFYYLVRCFQREIFVFMARSQWDEEVVDSLNSILIFGPLASEAKSTDLKLHLADVFLEELANSGTFDSGFTPNLLPTLLKPYFEIFAQSKERSLVERVMSRVFEGLVGERWLAASLQQGEEDADSLRNQKLRHVNRMFRHTYLDPIPAQDVCQLCLDRDFACATTKEVAQKIFSLAVKKSTPEFARKLLYSLLDQYSELCSLFGDEFEGDVDMVSDDGEDLVQGAHADKESAAFDAKQKAKKAKLMSTEEEGTQEKQRVSPGTKNNKKTSKSKVVATIDQGKEPTTASAHKKHKKSQSATEEDLAEEVAAREGVSTKPTGRVGLTAAERRAARQQLTVVAEGREGSAASSLLVPRTVSPRKHAATAADFFKEETGEGMEVQEVMEEGAQDDEVSPSGVKGARTSKSKKSGKLPQEQPDEVAAPQVRRTRAGGQIAAVQGSRQSATGSARVRKQAKNK